MRLEITGLERRINHLQHQNKQGVTVAWLIVAWLIILTVFTFATR